MSTVFFPIRVSAVLLALYVGVICYQYQSFRESLPDDTEKLTMELKHSQDPQSHLSPDGKMRIGTSSEDGRTFGTFLRIFSLSFLPALFSWVVLQVVFSQDVIQKSFSRLKSNPYWIKRLPWLIFWGVLGHRMVILLLHAHYLGGYIAQNIDALTHHYLTIENIVNHPWLSLLYLQQASPIPQFLLSLVVANWGWGVESHFVFIWIQSLTSAITAVLMFRVMCLFGKRRLLFAMMTLAFAFSPDLVLMETNWFGQTLFENLCMVWLLLMVLQFEKFCAERKLANAILMGIWTGLLSLTSSWFSLLFVPVLALMLLSKLRDKRVWVYGLIFVAGWAPLQIGWAVKNHFVYSYFNLNNSSWTGYHLLAGFQEVDLLSELLEAARQHEADLPSAFSAMYVENSELRMWDDIWPLRGELPDRVNEIDQQIIEKLGGSFRTGNTLAGKVFGDISKEAYFAAIKANPALLWQKIESDWTGFWRPIRECAHLSVGPFYTEPSIPDLLDTQHMIAQLVCIDADIVYRYDSKAAPGYREAMLLTIPLLPRIFWLWNIAVFVVLLVAIPMWSIWRWIRRKPLSSVSLALIFMVAIVFYLALLITVVAAGNEICRYRIPVEPILWVLGAIAIGGIANSDTNGRLKQKVD